MTKTHRNSSAAAEEIFHKHYAAIYGEERWHKTLYPALLQPTRYACLLNRYADLPATLRLLEDENACGPLEAINLPSLPKDESVGRSHGVQQDHRHNCYVIPHDQYQDQPRTRHFRAPFSSPRQDGNTVNSHWSLDAASVLVVHLLDVRIGYTVLDLCAAPGGKSIALAQRLWPKHYGYSTSPLSPANAVSAPTSILHSNEADPARHRRLAENLKLYLPPRLLSSPSAASAPSRGAPRIPPVQVLRLDASSPSATTALHSMAYDRVLVDAPCSSERHVIHAAAAAAAAAAATGNSSSKYSSSSSSSSAASAWKSPSSSKRLAATQLELLATGVRTARLGARIVYATCALEPAENDGVVGKLLARLEKERMKARRQGRQGMGWNVVVGLAERSDDEAARSLEEELLARWAEKTAHGYIVLPDHPAGGRWGPLYFSVLHKVAD